MSSQDTPALLRRLHEAGVDAVIIGGVAAIVHGSSLFTRDLDVVVRFDDDELARILDALRGLEPRFALDPNHRPLPDAVNALAGIRNLYVDTALGRIDFIGETPVGTWAELSDRALRLDLAGFEVKVSSLDDLIAMKEALGRPKDLIALVELRAVRERLARPE